MLIGFQVRNFRSFRDQTIFSMRAGKFTRHPEQVLACGDKKVLKSALLFGANASGKSNLIHAIAFARDAVLQGLDSIDTDGMYFRLDSTSKAQPGVFQFDFYANESYYSYGFALSYLDKHIVSEWLYRTQSGKEICLFQRDEKERLEGYEVQSDATFDADEAGASFKIYQKDFQAEKMRQKFFLKDVVERCSADRGYDGFLDAWKWLVGLTTIFPNSTFAELTKLLDDKSQRGELASLLSAFDTGVTSIEEKSLTMQDLLTTIPVEEREDFQKFYAEAARKGNVIQSRGRRLLEAWQDQDGDHVKEMLLRHGESKELFQLKDESDGTKRLFDLLPLLLSKQHFSVILVDELDRSFHTLLAKKFLESFFGKTKGLPSQMIVTTHDTNLLDLSFVRQDEIWFVERGRENDSKLYSLDKFKVRFDKDVMKDYLLGRYGAIPLLDALEESGD